MKVDIYLHKYEDKNLKGFADIVINDTVKIKSKIMSSKKEDEKSNENLFLSFPSYKVTQEDGTTFYQEYIEFADDKIRYNISDKVLSMYYEDKNKYTLNIKTEEENLHVFTTPYEKENLKGICTISLDSKIKIRNVTLRQGENDMYLSYPGYKTENKEIDIDQNTGEVKNNNFIRLVMPFNVTASESLKDKAILSYNRNLDKNKSVDIDNEI